MLSDEYILKVATMDDQYGTAPTQPKPVDLTGDEHRELMRLRLKVQAADCLAGAVDCMVYRKVIDARSVIADARLAYGEPFGADEAERLMKRTRPANER